MTENVEASLVFRIQRVAQGVEKGIFGLLLLYVLEVFPFFWLGFPDERDQHGGVERPDGVEVVRVRFIVPAASQQVFLYHGFERCFVVTAWHSGASLLNSSNISPYGRNVASIVKLQSSTSCRAFHL